MNDAIFTQLQKEMEGSVAALRKELGRVRTDLLAIDPRRGYSGGVDRGRS